MNLIATIHPNNLHAWNDSFDTDTVQSQRERSGPHPRTTEEAIEAARANVERSPALREMPIVVWNKVFAFTGWEGIDLMRRSSSVFVRTPGVSPYELQDCAKLYFKHCTLALPGREVRPPPRFTATGAPYDQAHELQLLEQRLRAISQELVELQNTDTSFQRIAPTDRLQEDDLPSILHHLFSDDDAPSPDFQARATRVMHFCNHLLMSDNDRAHIEKYAPPIAYLLLDIALHYSHFQCRIIRLDELRQLISSVSPEVVEFFKVVAYNILQHSQFQPHFSIAQALSHAPFTLESYNARRPFNPVPSIDTIAKNLLPELATASVQNTHSTEYPRWDLWLTYLPDVIRHTGLRALLLQDTAQVPIREQISTLAAKMLSFISQHPGTHPLPNCCRGLNTTLVNLGRLSLLDGRGNRVVVIEELMQRLHSLTPPFLQMIQYQHERQPFNQTETDALIHIAAGNFPSRDVDTLAHILGITPEALARLIHPPFLIQALRKIGPFMEYFRSLPTRLELTARTFYNRTTTALTNHPVSIVASLVLVALCLQTMYVATLAAGNHLYTISQNVDEFLRGIGSRIQTLAETVAASLNGTVDY